MDAAGAQSIDPYWEETPYRFEPGMAAVKRSGPGVARRGKVLLMTSI